MKDADASIESGTPGLDALAEEFVARYRKGERPSLSEYTERHPEMSAEIRDLFPALVLMEDARPSASHHNDQLTAENDVPPKLKRLGDYRILREVGRGGMGIVYEAEQESLGRHVALKVLPAHSLLDPRHLRRFQREARAAARLHHTNIVPVFGVGEQDGLHYYVMQFIQGLGLDEVLGELRQLRKDKSSGSPNRERPKPPAAALDQVNGTPKDATLPSGSRAEASASIDSCSAAQLAESLLLGSCAMPESGVSRNHGTSRAAVPFHVGLSSADGSSSSVHLPGQDTRKNMSDTGREYWQSVARIGLQVADALTYANSQGILHRDIKPSNLLLDTQGTVWVTDFGLAKADDGDDLTHTGDIVGTLRYLAPERLRGESDQRSDIYSLGATLYELLTFRPTFDGSDRHQLVRQIAEEEPPRPRAVEPELPFDLETIVLKAMAKERADRYQTPAELAADLRQFLEDRPIHARRVSQAERLWRWCRRNRSVAGLTAAVILLVGVLGVGAPVMRMVWSERDRAVANLNRAVEAESVARQNQDRAERAELEVKARSHLATATAHRRSGRAGQRFRCLEELVAAVRLNPPDELRRELRDEAVAALGLSDLNVTVERDVAVLTDPQCDPQLKRYAFVDLYGQGETLVRRMDDDQVELTIPGVEFPFWHATTDFTPDGRYLLITYFPRGAPAGHAVLHVWDIEAKEKVLAREIQSGDVIGAVTARGEHLFFVDRQLQLCQWNLTQRREETLFLVGMTPYGICIDAAGRRIAMNDYRARLLRILDLANGAELASWTKNVGRYGMAWSSDGQFIVSGDEGRLYIWNVPLNSLSSVKEAQGVFVKAAFANRGHLLATTKWDGTTVLWDAASGRELVQSVGKIMRFSDDDRQLAYSRGTAIGIWQVAHGIESRSIVPAGDSRDRLRDNSVFGSSFSADGRMMAIASMEGVWLYDRATGEMLGHLPCGATARVLFRDDGQCLVTNSLRTGICNWPIARKTQGSSDVLTIGPPTLVRNVEGSDAVFAGLFALAWLPGQNAVVVADNLNRRVLVVPLDPSNGSENDVIELPSRHGRITNLAVSPDGRWIAAGCWKADGVQIWNLAERRFECLLPHSDSKIATTSYVFISPDNRWLLVAMQSENTSGYRAHRVGTWERGMTIAAEFATDVGVVFSGDGRLMAMSVNPNQTLIAADDGRELMRLTNDHGRMVPAALNRDGSELVLVSGPKPSIWWNLSRLQKQLLALGLAWDSSGTLTDGESAQRAESKDTVTGTDGWSDSSTRLLVQLDLGSLPERAAAHHYADAALEQLRVGRVLVRAKNWPMARSAFERALELNPNDASIQNDLAWLLAVCPDRAYRDSDRSYQLAQKAVAMRPDNPNSRNTLGVAHYRMGNWRAAISELDKAEQLAPGRFFGFNAIFMAMAHWQLGERDVAQDWLERANAWTKQHLPDDEELKQFHAEAAELFASDP